MAFSPDGKQIAAVDVEKKIKVWDALSGKEKLSLKIGGGGSSLAFSPDGKWIAGGGLSGVIQIWNAARGQEILTLKRHMGYVTSVAFSRDGKRIASGSYDRTLRVWDAASGRELLTRSHRDYVTCVLFSPDSKRVASGGLDPTVRVWDAMSGQEVLVIRTGRDYVSRLAFSPDGQRIAIGCSSYSTTGITKVLNVESGQEILTLNGHTAAYSPDGKWIATGTGVYGGPGRNPLGQSIELWDATTGKSFLAVKDPGSGITDPIFSADGKRIASLSAGNTIKVWDATNGRTLLTLKGHATNVSCVAFSPDGNRLASGSREGAIKIWNATNGGQVLTLKLGGGLGHTYDYLTSVVFSPDGKRLIGGTYFEGVKIFDSSTGRELLNLGKDQLASVACSPDGSRIASGNIYGTIRLFDAASGREALILKAYQSSVNSLVFSVDGKRLASGSRDGVVKIWDASSSPEKLSQIETADQANSDAWNLATDPNTSLRDPRRAVELAQRAVGLAPLEGNYWNTLGVAEYRAGDWHSAETALRKSMSLRGGGDSADWFFLAMVTWNQGEKDRAHNWYRAARLWMTRSSPNEELQRFRSEAAALLGLPVRISSEPDDSAALVDVLAEAKPASSSSYFARGQVFADLGQWDRADADFTKAIETGEKDVEAWSMRALVRLAENDQPGFRAACQAMLDQFAKTTDAQTASSVARTCSLAPDAISDFGPAIALAQRAVGDQPLWHEYSQGLGAILYRAGQFEKSVRQLRDLEDLREFEPRLTARAYTAFFLAMAEHRLRHPAEAKKWLAKARDAMANSPQSRGNRGRHSSWAGNLTMKILRHEAEALIENASSPDREMRK
jgi:WD40 repeat protein/Flp pilus assembly protein TadD